mmetsp:Transcript_15351/g.31048  ORF Transcript_15351/g.31048 Transcript_15351/m.31048 type:complete len:233 (-) Transcript_15351:176-874(-)
MWYLAITEPRTRLLYAARRKHASFRCSSSATASSTDTASSIIRATTACTAGAGMPPLHSRLTNSASTASRLAASSRICTVSASVSSRTSRHSGRASKKLMKPTSPSASTPAPATATTCRSMHCSMRRRSQSQLATISSTARWLAGDCASTLNSASWRRQWPRAKSSRSSIATSLLGGRLTAAATAGSNKKASTAASRAACRMRSPTGCWASRERNLLRLAFSPPSILMRAAA